MAQLNRLRSRVSCTLSLPAGSFDHVEQQLSTFGINSIQLAVSHSGEKKTDKHKEYLKAIKAIEEARVLSPSKLIVLIPSQTDVLLGRGKPIQNHPGVSSVEVALVGVVR